MSVYTVKGVHSTFSCGEHGVKHVSANSMPRIYSKPHPLPEYQGAWKSIHPIAPLQLHNLELLNSTSVWCILQVVYKLLLHPTWHLTVGGEEEGVYLEGNSREPPPSLY